MLLLTNEQVRECTTVSRIIEVNAVAFCSLESGDAEVPPRIMQTFRGVEGSSLFKPASLVSDDLFAQKVIHVRPQNAALGKATTPATIMVFNKQTGEPKCLMNATFLTALRTASASALAVSAAANPNSKCLVVFGAGLQAEAHIKTVTCVSPEIQEIFIINRSKERAEALAKASANELHSCSFHCIALMEKDEVKEACSKADIVCTTTGSAEPLFDGTWIKPGALVCAVGSYQKETTEVDLETLKRCSQLIVDTNDAFEAGDLQIPLEQGIVSEGDAITLGQLQFRGSLDPGKKKTTGDITFFKSVGTAIQDICSALQVYRDAAETKIGVEVQV